MELYCRIINFPISTIKKNFAYLTKDKESGILSQISFSKLALDLADWASASGNIDQVCTFYELATGPETGKYLFRQ